MSPIRILVASLPRMLGDILQQAIDEQSDMELVSALGCHEDPRVMISRLKPDVVLVSEPDAIDEMGPAALARAQPGAHIVTLSATGRRAVIVGPGGQSLVLEGASPTLLLCVLTCHIRKSARHGYGEGEKRTAAG